MQSDRLTTTQLMRHFLTRLGTRAGALIVLPTALAFTTAGCLVGDPPPYEEPEVIYPRAIVNEAVPSVFQRLDTSNDQVQPFIVPFVSEDLGERILAHLWLNYGQPDEFELGRWEVPAGTIDDLERSITINWTMNPTIPPGCYIITMLIGRSDDIDFSTQKPKEDRDDRVAFVHWTVAHGLPPHEITLQDCPPVYDTQGL